MRDRPELAALLEAVQDLARKTGEVALHSFRKNLRIELKTDGSEVTSADRNAETAAREWIERHFPDDGVMGEELGVTQGRSARRWFIDPIDGTRTFVRGVPLWGSLVGVEEHGSVLAGAIFCPATGDLVAAARGQGCWHNGVRAQVSGEEDLSRATILATDAQFRDNPERAARWSRLASRVSVARTWGDCYGYVLVATGRAELMVDHRLSPWDVAAVVPVIEEAGGVFTDWQGRPGIGRDGIATNAHLAAVCRDALGVPSPPATTQ